VRVFAVTSLPPARTLINLRGQSRAFLSFDPFNIDKLLFAEFPEDGAILHGGSRKMNVVPTRARGQS
jgi:hypothetical protein